jgi:hypothetical protein
MQKRQKGLAQLLRPCGHAATWFQGIAAPFPLLASLVEGCIIVERRGPIALGRYHRPNVLREEGLAEAMAVIPCIPNRMGQRGRGRPLRHHRLKDGGLMPVPCREDYRAPGAFIATAGMDVGGEASPRTAQSLCGVSPVFFNAPAAC